MYVTNTYRLFKMADERFAFVRDQKSGGVLLTDESGQHYIHAVVLDEKPVDDEETMNVGGRKWDLLWGKYEKHAVKRPEGADLIDLPTVHM